MFAYRRLAIVADDTLCFVIQRVMEGVLAWKLPRAVVEIRRRAAIAIDTLIPPHIRRRCDREIAIGGLYAQSNVVNPIAT